MHRVVSGITVFRCNTTTTHFMLFSNHARDALGAQASTSAVNVGDDHDECLPRTRATPRFAPLEQHPKNYQEAGRKVPATLSAIAEAVQWAEEIMKAIDERWPAR